jgi:hypothetical protein
MKAKLCVVVTLMCALAGCKKKSATGETSDEAIVKEVAGLQAKQIADLEAAFAAGDDVGVSVNCLGTDRLEHMPAEAAAKLRKLCHVDAPRFLLQKAIADARKNMAEHPDLPDMRCFQLFAGDAFKILAKHPTADAATTKLVDEYAGLCPKEVAKLRAH